MSMAVAGNSATRSTINVTPLIDVLLVLLIIFMVIQPASIQGLNAVAPKPHPGASTPPPSRTIVIEVERNDDGRIVYRVNGSATESSSVAATLQTLSHVHGDRQLFVQGDSRLEYQPVLDVVNQAHASGIETVGLITPQTRIGR